MFKSSISICALKSVLNHDMIVLLYHVFLYVHETDFNTID